MEGKGGGGQPTELIGVQSIQETGKGEKGAEHTEARTTTKGGGNWEYTVREVQNPLSLHC